MKYIEAGVAVEVLKKFLRDIYDDDVATSVRTVHEGFEFYSVAERCFMEGWYELRKWDSNSSKLLGKIDAEEVNKRSCICRW